MNLHDVRALRGPNRFARFPVIHAAVEPGDAERWIEVRQLLALMPGRIDACGKACPTAAQPVAPCPLPHAALHVAAALLRAAGDAEPRGWPREEPGFLAIPYEEERSGILAAHLASGLVGAAARGEPVDVHDAIARVAEERAANIPGPSTKSILDEARARGIPTLRLDDSHYQLGHGCRQARIQTTMTSRTSAIGVETADDKTRTKDMLRDAGVPVPRGAAARTFAEAARVAARIGYPVVVKPREGNHGRGVTVGVASVEELEAAYDRAREIDSHVIVEETLIGSDFRLLAIDHVFVAAARRDPAQVVGDGARTLIELVEELNSDPRRGDGHEKSLTRVRIDEDTLAKLAKQGLDLESVPEAGRVVALKTTANLSTGGTATDVTDEVHAAIREMVERVSRVVDLDVCGVDVVASTLSRPLEETGGGVCEVNAAPGFRMHLDPANGPRRNVAVPVVEMLFPPGAPSRIPIVAVTGTNGKTTTSRLIAHALGLSGGRVGLACTDGVEVRGRRVLSGDYSGPGGAHAVLKDGTVTHAVLEVARGGILRRGLGFDECDVGLLLNVENDHLGSEGIDTIEQLARLKATVTRAVKRNGVAVLNAEDPLSLAAAEETPGRVVLFSADPEAPAVVRHVAAGGEALTVRNGTLVRLVAQGETPIARVEDVPLTMGGAARCNVQNALAAAAASLALGLTVGDIASALKTFHPSPAHVPGRLNLFEKKGVRVLVDYGHNPPALRAIESTLSALQPARRIVSASATGNRRDEDLREFGAWLARLYDEVHLSDPDPRGRAPGETAALVREGIASVGGRPVEMHGSESEAIRAALGRARAGDLVVLQAEDVTLAIRAAATWEPEGGPVETAPTPIAVDARA